MIDRCFAGTASRIQGVDFNVLAEEALRRHSLGYPEQAVDRLPVLPNPGEFHWRADGERHMWDPPAIADLQVAARNNSARRLSPLRRSRQSRRANSLRTARPACSSSRARTAARFRSTK